jgi:transmembrane sensor
MPEPLGDLDAALSRVADRWDPARTERTLESLHVEKQRRTVRRRAAWSGAAVAVAVVAVGLWVRPWDGARTWNGTESRPGAADEFSRHIQLADGSQVWLRDAASRVHVAQDAPQRVALELQAGAARFDVTHVEGRVFRVQSGVVAVEVLGTRFDVEQAGDRTRVEVSRGRVAVSWPEGRVELAAGEAGWFPRAEPDPLAAQQAAVPSPTGPARSARAGESARRASAHGSSASRASADRAQPLAASPAAQRAAAAAASASAAAPAPAQGRAQAAEGAARSAPAKAWREAAEPGEFEHAYKLLEGSANPVADDVEELLLAADSARLSGHPEAALPFLRKVIDRHTRDSRAPLAAFTLGGVLMQQLGQPREAEAAYARARELSLNESLAEDALARQVEAAHRAGDAARARALAREYMDSYPSGRRTHAVQRFGGLTR